MSNLSKFVKFIKISLNLVKYRK